MGHREDIPYEQSLNKKPDGARSLYGRVGLGPRCLVCLCLVFRRRGESPEW